MVSARTLIIGALLLGAAACQDNPLKSQAPAEPAPPAEGIQAFVQVDNDSAQPGDVVHVWVKVQMGTQNAAKLGSYQGRLAFAPASLEWKSGTPLSDGMRVTNPAAASAGDIRFAGIAAKGFDDLTLYQGTFVVKKSDYMDHLGVKMEELSAALSLTNLKPQLQIVPQVFLRVAPR